VTIVLRHNEALELNLVEYRDVVSLAELKALAQFAAANPEHMVRDGLAIVMPNARFSDVDAPALDASSRTTDSSTHRSNSSCCAAPHGSAKARPPRRKCAIG
jgi:hypothetical protein